MGCLSLDIFSCWSVKYIYNFFFVSLSVLHHDQISSWKSQNVDFCLLIVHKFYLINSYSMQYLMVLCLLWKWMHYSVSIYRLYRFSILWVFAYISIYPRNTAFVEYMYISTRHRIWRVSLRPQDTALLK